MSLYTDSAGGVSLRLATREITSTPYYPTKSDCVLLCDATSAAITIGLKSGFERGQVFRVEKTDASANAITIMDHAGTTVATVTTRYHAVEIQRKNNGSWLVTNRDLVALILDVGDESTDLTAAAGKKFFRMPFAMNLQAVRASVNTAPVGSTIIVDINEGAGAGTSILSTKLSIDASEFTSTTAASAAVISDSALADDAQISIDIDQIGSGTAGKGLKVYLIGTRA